MGARACVCDITAEQTVSAYEHVWIGGNENTLSSVTCDSFKSFKLRLFSNNELASFTIVFESCCFFYKYKRFRLFHFLEQKKHNGVGANTGIPCESELLSRFFIQPFF